MALIVKRGYTNDPINKVDRSVTTVQLTNPDLKMETDVTRPSLLLNVPDNLKSAYYTQTNEFYIDAFKRWYAVDNFRFVNAGRIQYNLSVDLLKTYATDIKANTLYVTRQQNDYNKYLVDDQLPRLNSYLAPASADYDIGFTPSSYCYVAQIVGGTPGVSGGVTTLILDELAFGALVSNFFSLTSTIFNKNPSENVLQCVKLPISAATLSGLAGGSAATSVRVGSEVVQLAVGAYVTSTSTVTMYDGAVTFPAKYGNEWRDFESDYSVYVPYCGTIQLNGADVFADYAPISTTIYARMTLDIISGDIITTFYQRKGDLILGYTELVKWTMSGNCGINNPVAGGNFSSLLSGAASIVTGVAGAVSGNPAAVAAGAMGLVSSVRDVSYNAGVLKGAASWQQPQKLTIVRTDRAYLTPTEHASTKGLPLYEKRLGSSLSGFTQCANVQLTYSGSPSPTEAEKTALKNLLESGVIF